MSRKRTEKHKLMKHPFTRDRLRVLDSFTPRKPVACPKCTEQFVDAIRVVESEYPGGVRYHVLSCRQCGQDSWVVLNE
jgi:hypothetical protein